MRPTRPLRVVASLLAAATALALAAPTVPATADPVVPGVFFVSTSGDDGTGDGSAVRPWRTIHRAADAVPPASTIVVSAGTYSPFEVSQPGTTVTAAPGEQVVVQGRAGVRDVVNVLASGVTVSGLTVRGCVPNPEPPGSYEDTASSTVRIDDGADGVTLTGLTIRGARFRNYDGLVFGCYGISTHDADAFRIVRNDISGVGAGVFVHEGGMQGIVADNEIHGLNSIIRNTPGGDDDYGGTAITFANVDAVPGVLATRNTIYDNAGPSSDYGWDGGGFELYNASNTQIIGNVLRDNVNVLETGANPGGDCVSNVFAGNQASGRGAGSRLDYAVGLILRCATLMVVDHNTFTDLDWWVYELTGGDRFSTDVDGLALTGNTHSQRARVYRLAVDPVEAKLVVEGNRFPRTGSTFASYGDGTVSRTLADWQQRTGLDRLSPPA